MKTFQEFMLIAESTYDASFMSGAQVRKTGEGGRIGQNRKKTTPEIRRMKAVGGGKMEPVSYKPRKDIGNQSGSRSQQPTQDRGSADVKARAAAAAKAERKKAALARIAAKKSVATAKPTSKELKKAGTQLLSKKKEQKPAAPGYKPREASGLSPKERNKQTREGERMLRGIMKDQETKKYEGETGEKPKGKAKTKILAHVERRMAN